MQKGPYSIENDPGYKRVTGLLDLCKLAIQEDDFAALYKTIQFLWKDTFAKTEFKPILQFYTAVYYYDKSIKEQCRDTLGLALKYILPVCDSFPDEAITFKLAYKIFLRAMLIDEALTSYQKYCVLSGIEEDEHELSIMKQLKFMIEAEMMQGTYLLGNMHEIYNILGMDGKEKFDAHSILSKSVFDVNFKVVKSKIKVTLKPDLSKCIKVPTIITDNKIEDIKSINVVVPEIVTEPELPKIIEEKIEETRINNIVVTERPLSNCDISNNINENKMVNMIDDNIRHDVKVEISKLCNKPKDDDVTSKQDIASKPQENKVFVNMIHKEFWSDSLRDLSKDDFSIYKGIQTRHWENKKKQYNYYGSDYNQFKLVNPDYGDYDKFYWLNDRINNNVYMYIDDPLKYVYEIGQKCYTTKDYRTIYNYGLNKYDQFQIKSKSKDKNKKGHGFKYSLPTNYFTNKGICKTPNDIKDFYDGYKKNRQRIEWNKSITNNKKNDIINDDPDIVKFKDLDNLEEGLLYDPCYKGTNLLATKKTTDVRDLYDIAMDRVTYDTVYDINKICLNYNDKLKWPDGKQKQDVNLYIKYKDENNTVKKSKVFTYNGPYIVISGDKEAYVKVKLGNCVYLAQMTKLIDYSIIPDYLYKAMMVYDKFDRGFIINLDIELNILKGTKSYIVKDKGYQYKNKDMILSYFKSIAHIGDKL